LTDFDNYLKGVFITTVCLEVSGKNVAIQLSGAQLNILYSFYIQSS